MLGATPLHASGLGLRRATTADGEELGRLRQLSLQRLMVPSLTELQRRTLYEYTAFDPRLIQNARRLLCQERDEDQSERRYTGTLEGVPRLSAWEEETLVRDHQWEEPVQRRSIWRKLFTVPF